MTTTTQDRIDKRDKLVEAAATVFARHGFVETRVADIAVEAEVGKGTVYEYFASKEELFFAVFEQIHDEIARRINAVAASTSSPRDQLLRILRVSGEIVVEKRELQPLNLDFWAATRGSAFEMRFTEACQQLYRDYRKLLADILRRGQETGDFRRQIDVEGTATLVVGALDGLAIQYWFDDSVDPVSASEQFAHTLFSGLCLEEV